MQIYSEGAPFELEGILNLIQQRVEKQVGILNELVDYPVRKDFLEDIMAVQFHLGQASDLLRDMKGKWSKE